MCVVRDINAVLILNQSDDIVEVRFGPSEFWLVVKNGVSESMIRVGTKKCRLELWRFGWSLLCKTSILCLTLLVCLCMSLHASLSLNLHHRLHWRKCPQYLIDRVIWSAGEMHREVACVVVVSAMSRLCLYNYCTWDPPDTRLYSYAVISSMEGGPSLAEMWWPLPMLTKSAAFVR